ncbi:MAG: adenosylmethionine decarboxylase [Candidatus Colwellbacteria bacterium]|nr:adenosylmethionine decarboxylase [Candidatus Colwellbacteria bacterium]
MHLLADVHGVEFDLLQNTRLLKRFLAELPERLRMRLLAEPSVKKVQSPDYPDWGVSGFVMLYESHISLHTWPERGYVAIDVFSCKKFNVEKTLTYLARFFSSHSIRSKIVARK